MEQERSWRSDDKGSWFWWVEPIIMAADSRQESGLEAEFGWLNGEKVPEEKPWGEWREQGESKWTDSLPDWTYTEPLAVTYKLAL